MIELYQKRDENNSKCHQIEDRGPSGKGGGCSEGQPRRMEVMINSIRSKLEKTIKHWVEDVLVSIDQRTRPAQ
jgi:hypothetical protein